MHRFTANGSALLIIDVQERLIAAMPEARRDRLINRTLAAIDGARALNLPIVVTEQYPKGLGPTLPVLRARLGADVSPIEKLEFSALVPQVKERFAGRSSILVMGMETHVCVFQTVRALAAEALQPYLAVDAVLSRTETDERVGVELCRQVGATLSTVETALFDALERAGGPAFKAISQAVK